MFRRIADVIGGASRAPAAELVDTTALISPVSGAAGVLGAPGGASAPAPTVPASTVLKPAAAGKGKDGGEKDGDESDEGDDGAGDDAKKADDDDDARADDGDDARADDGDDAKKGKAGKKGRKAKDELDPDDEGDEGGGDDDPDDDDEDEGDDEGDDDEARGKKGRAVRAARRHERARCAAILTHPAAARAPELAARLAFATRLPRSEAVALLDAAPASAGTGNRGIDARMSSQAPPRVASSPAGAAAPGSEAEQLAASILAAGRKRRGES